MQKRVRDKRSYKFYSILILVILFSTFIIPNVFAASNPLSEAKNIIKNHYVKEVPDSLLNSAKSVQELTQLLNDPNIVYFSSSELSDIINNNNKLYDIGIIGHVINGEFRIISIYMNSPAQAAGLKVGDLIISANGKMLSGMPYSKSMSYIQGAEGTTVHLIVRRGSNSYKYDIKRNYKFNTEVESKIFDSIGFIRLPVFNNGSANAFSQALDNLNLQNPSSYVIDLRDNAGGYIEEVLNISGNFISNQTVMHLKDRLDADMPFFSQNTDKLIEKPVIFLVNENSASGSEILIAAVRDYKKAFIIGKKTNGSCLIQSIFQLSDDSAIKLPVFSVFSPLGNIIDKKGITPDLDSGDVDSLLIAKLLSTNDTELIDKSGFTKVKFGDWEFKIDLSKARLPKYWNAYKQIIDEALLSGEISIGTTEGYAKEVNNYSYDQLKYYYPDYRVLPDLNNVPTNKKFSISFSSPISIESLEENSIELIDKLTGERLELGFKQNSDWSIEAIPKKALLPDSVYYFVINNTFKGKDGENLSEGKMFKVTVKQ